jgi:phospholipid/cholesterol/gamma-HCH transport system substrate-binding protein
MSENSAEIAVGGLTLAVAVGFFVYASQSSGFAGRGAETYPLTASFRSAQGVGLGTDVRLAGVRIGTVTGMELNPESFRADMVFAIDAEIEVPEDSSVAVAREGLLGGNFVEIVPGGSPFALEPGGEIVDTQGALSLIGLLSQFINAASGD